MIRALAELQPRERAMVIAALVLLLVLMIYGLVWKPFAARVDHLSQGVEEQREIKVWMREAAAQVQSLRLAQGAATQRSGGQSLLAVVDRTAKGGKLSGSMKRVEPEGDNAVRVWFEGAPFDDLIAWLEQLEGQYGVTARTSTIDRQDEPGRVNARLVLEGTP